MQPLLEPSNMAFAQWAVQVGGPIGLLALLVFYFWRKDANANAAAIKVMAENYAAQWKGQTEMLFGIVKENTQAITANTRTIDALHARLDHDRDDLGRQRPRG